MRRIFLLFLGLLTVLVNAQQTLNEGLKKELDEIMKVDQGYRMLFTSDVTPEKREEVLKKLNIDQEDFKKRGWEMVVEHDSINMHKVEGIISKYGYPGKTLVGEPTNQAVWYVIQHSNKIGKYLPLIKEAGKKNEIPFTMVAMMEDRFLMNENKEQIYGTQGSRGMIKDKDGKPVLMNFVWPIKDHQNVNKRRKEAGFNTSIEEIAKKMFGQDFKYEPYTLQKVLELRDKK